MPRALLTALTWSSSHMKDARIPDESLMMTGDDPPNLIDVKAVVRYRVVNPRVFLFEAGKPAEVLRANTESELRTTIAGRQFLDLLTVQRAELEEEVFQRLKKRIKQLDANNLGIELEGLSLVDLHPPSEVVNSYYDVAKAMEYRRKAIMDAKKDAVTMKQEAEKKYEAILSEARADKVEKVSKAQGETDRFLALSNSRRNELDFFQEMRLRMDSIDAVLAGKERPNMKGYERRRDEYLRGGLTDFRIFWDTVNRSLKGREVVLIDAEPMKGQHNLFLFDPDVLRAPPVIMPQGKQD